MRLYFVRHGESEANLARIFSNRGFKHPLTPRGVAQAQALATHLAGHSIAQIFSSPLQRAVQTADTLSQAFGAPVEITAALREWDVGILEDTTDQHGWDLHGAIQEEWFVHKRLERKIPEGESFLDIQARFVPFIRQLVQAATQPSQAVALVGHGGLYHAMLPIILQNIDYSFVAEHPFANTAYALAETRPDGLYCREWCGVIIED
jgi:probable phosphoglycerate mutase